MHVGSPQNVVSCCQGRLLRMCHHLHRVAEEDLGQGAGNEWPVAYLHQSKERGFVAHEEGEAEAEEAWLVAFDLHLHLDLRLLPLDKSCRLLLLLLETGTRRKGDPPMIQ